MTAVFQMHSSQAATGLSVACKITSTPVFPKMETILLLGVESKAFFFAETFATYIKANYINYINWSAKFKVCSPACQMSSVQFSFQSPHAHLLCLLTSCLHI